MVKNGERNGHISSIQEPIRDSRICNNCGGNGYVKIDTNEEKNAIKQCWICQSEGELKKYVQKDVDRFIYDFYFNNGMQER